MQWLYSVPAFLLSTTLDHLFTYDWGNSSRPAYAYDPMPHEIPDYVAHNSPLVYLYSEEKYMPGSVVDYVPHFAMATANENCSYPLELSNLTAAGEDTRRNCGEPLYMSAQYPWDNGEEWVTCQENVPSLATGYIDAAATLIVVNRTKWVDAFWFYFYPFNEGPYVMGRGPFGNHLGDWEHTLVRFKEGKPVLLWMSAHGGGAAYRWDGLDLTSYFPDRPAIFAARGTHANYITVGQHSHDIPWHMLSDFTDRGYLWDPSQNFLAYTFDGHKIHPANGSEPDREQTYGDWLLFDGYWGDRKLKPTDPRQSWSPFEWRMIDGPQGPLFKNLMRVKPCERHKWWNVFGACRVRHRPNAGDGVEADRLSCPWILDRLPKWMQYPTSWVLYEGWLCYCLDILWG